jgi:hypothetical protein
MLLQMRCMPGQQTATAASRRCLHACMLPCFALPHAHVCILHAWLITQPACCRLCAWLPAALHNPAHPAAAPQACPRTTFYPLRKTSDPLPLPPCAVQNSAHPAAAPCARHRQRPAVPAESRHVQQQQQHHHQQLAHMLLLAAARLPGCHAVVLVCPAPALPLLKCKNAQPAACHTAASSLPDPCCTGACVEALQKFSPQEVWSRLQVGGRGVLGCTLVHLALAGARAGHAECRRPTPCPAFNLHSRHHCFCCFCCACCAEAGGAGHCLHGCAYDVQPPAVAV